MGSKNYFSKGEASDEQKEVDREEHRRHFAVFEAIKDPLTASDHFYVWWKGDPHRYVCTLLQAVQAYMKTFPGRTTTLLGELLEANAIQHVSITKRRSD